MTIATEKLRQFLDSLGGRPEDNLKMLLYYGDLGGEFTDDEDWGALCEFALAVDEELGMSSPFSSRYLEMIGREEFQDAIDAMEYDLKDNKVFAAMAIHKMGVPKDMPMVAAAAFNKHAYQGLKDEFAIIRFLHWSGFDIDAANSSTGMTPLHLLSFTKVQPGTHLRAVKWLLEHEADVDAVNAKGDTAMAYLCGSQQWGPPQNRAFMALLKAGSHPFAKAEDGSTPYGLLVKANEADFSAERAATIQALAGVMKEVMERVDDQASPDDEGRPKSAAQLLARSLVEIGERIKEIRAFYLDEDAQAANREEAGQSAWITADGEQYLKRVYQLSMGFALRNNLYGRPEFYGAEVAAVFEADHDLAKFFNPHALLPIVDLLHERLVAQLVATIARKDQKTYAQGVLESLKTSQDLHDLIKFGQGDELAMRRHWGERAFEKYEALGYGPVARHAAWTHIYGLFASGWGDGLMGLPMESSYPACYASEIAAHVANSHMARDGVQGRALVFALMGLAMQMSQGLLVGYGVPEEVWGELPVEAWCEGAGSYAGQIAVRWGLEAEPFPDAKTVANDEVSDPRLAAFVELMRTSLVGDLPADEPEPKPNLNLNLNPNPNPNPIPEGSSMVSSAGEVAASVETRANDLVAPVAQSDKAESASDADGIPPELMAAAKAWRAKGGNLGALGRWAFNRKSTPESEARDRELDIEWAKRRLGTPQGDKIIADAKKAALGAAKK
jgi:hypothetical protein